MSDPPPTLGGMPDATPSLPNLLLASSEIDRDAAARAGQGFVRGLLQDASTKVLEVFRDRTALDGRALGWRAPSAADLDWYENEGVVLYLGRAGESARLALLRPADDSREDLLTLRHVALDLDHDDLAALTTAVALSHWHATHGHCPRCGGATLPRRAGWVRYCPNDESLHFPRTDPAVIMAVVHPGEGRDDERILLARGPRWKGPHRSVLAGFVEPGESFEAAVARETFEESGVVVDDVRYLGNQPWPFPASLMIGFVATARTTALTPEDGEIEEIGWYSRADIERGLAEGTLRLPGRISIARSLIEHWYGAELPDGVEGGAA